MPTTMFHHFSAAHYEQVVAETARFLHLVPASATAVHLKAQAHYQLGEYADCAALLEQAMVCLIERESLETRLQFAALLANALLEEGRYEDVTALVVHAAPADASAIDAYGEVLLAGAWAAYFEGRYFDAQALIRRVYECSGEPFTGARASLCAALAARREDPQGHRDKAYLVRAQHQMTQARNLLGHPEPVRSVFRIQIQLARRGVSDEVGALLQETQGLPPGSKIASLLRETADLYMRQVLGELDEAAVIAAVARGVKRPWVALLPGAGVRLDPPAAEGESAGRVPALRLDRAPGTPAHPAGRMVEELQQTPHLAESPEIAALFGGGEAPPVAAPPPARKRVTPRALPSPVAPGEDRADREEKPAPRTTNAAAPAPTPVAPTPPAEGGIPVAPVSESAFTRGRSRPASPAAPRVPTVRTAQDMTVIRRARGPSGGILLIEPVERVARAFAASITDSPLRLTATVPDVDTALDRILQVRPTLVVVDVQALGAGGTGSPTDGFQRLLEAAPEVRLAVIATAATRQRASEAVLHGARARIDFPFERAHVLAALQRAMLSRSAAEALRVPTLELQRPVTCGWKPLENGEMMGCWNTFTSRTLDPMGLEARLDSDLKLGRAVRVNIEVPGQAKPIPTLAEVISCRPDPGEHGRWNVRFSFLKLPADARERLVAFLMDELSRDKPAGGTRAVS